MRSNTVVVIGAGIMGLGVAWQLTKAGRDVVILERDQPGAGASRAAAGMLAPTAELEFDEKELLNFGLASQQRWPSFVEELEADAGVSIEFETTGTLLVAWDRDEAEELERHYLYQKELGLEVEWLSGRGMRKMEGMLSQRIVGGVHCPKDVQVSNRCLVEALLAAALAKGATLRTGVEVERLLYEEGRVKGVRTIDGEHLYAEMTVVAGGAWSRVLSIDGEMVLPIRPVKGQMMGLEMDPRYPLTRHVIRRHGEGVYLVPKKDGTLVVGATSEEMGFDRRLTAFGLRTLLEGAFEIMPGIDELPIKETWVGFRPASRDGGPLLGRSSIPGLSVITGHYRNGIQQSPLSIEVVTADILHGEMPEVARPFHASRFSPKA